MSKFIKSHWIADETRVSLAMDISKVDRENRLVSGFATLDNVDTSDDVVTAEASKGAFEAFRGNIREMHQPIAAGRLVDFREEEFYHDGEFFRGIYATAYVSKGAEDTWEKVLDGTLSGFSIGGNITQQVNKFVKDAGENGKTIRYIEKYDLIELSLVDNPANQLANIFSIVKNQDGGSIMKGMVMDTTVINIFWCAQDEIAKNSTKESEDCLSCGNTMTRIGWFEQGEDNAVKTASAVATFLRHKEDKSSAVQSNDEGGVNMTENITKSSEEEVVTEEIVEETPEEVVAEEVVADEAEVVEEVASEPDFEKMFDDLKGSVNESLEKSKETVEKAVEAVDTRVSEMTKVFDAKSSEFEKALGELTEGLAGIRQEREDVAKRLDSLEKASAIKKSGEVETTPPVKKVQKGLWSGTFFNGE